ncbi:type III-A CRISPR-associated protein Cas10/Csm1 [Thermoplasmatales archaeon ex4484_30]|nr:MAG: type III-A CRISPR-associated protein Cas10/Csm1 [Thermoplasmatales archaeon ex4484_30]
MQEEIMKLRFASLLHDELSAKFIRQYLPNELQKGLTFVAGHHDASQYLSQGYHHLKMLVLADWLASSERRDLNEEEEKGKRKKMPMETIFTSISLDHNKDVERKYHNIELLSLNESVFPLERKDISQELEDNYRKLWNNFIAELGKIEYKNSERYLISLYYLLKKYTSRIPSAVWQSRPDISLFDHSKITCAIMESIYKNNMNEEEIGKILEILNKKSKNENLTEEEKLLLNKDRFSLIGGDISGIQRFIYSITSKGAAKGLKGRSFYLQLLGEAIAKYILNRVGLSIANLIYSAGGHFYIFAPQNVDINGIRKELEEILMEIHNGELYVAVDKVDLSISDLIEKRIGEKWKELGNKLEERKKKKFSNILDKKQVSANVYYVKALRS